MTTILERVPLDNGKSYERAMPVRRASDKGVDKHLAEALRESCYRRGLIVETLTDDELVKAAVMGVESML